MPNGDNKFAFLEDVLTSESLRALQRVDRETARRMQQSMTANEKSGFGVGRMLFGALSNAFGPGKKRKELAEQGDAALAAAEDAMSQIPAAEFEGPHGGLKRNLARAQSLADALRAQGLQEDAMRAQIAANNFQTQLAEAEDKAEVRALTNEGQRSLNEQRRLANESARRAGVLDARTYYLDTDTGEIIDSLDSRPEKNPSFPMQNQRILNNNPNILPLTRAEYLRYMEDKQDTLEESDFNLLTKSRFDDNRQTLISQTESLSLGSRVMEVWQDAKGNPLTTVSAAERFGNRLANEMSQFSDFYDANLSRAARSNARGQFSNEPLSTEEGRLKDVRAWMQERGLERQMSASLIQRLTWTLTRQFNGSRPTDKDYERIYMMLGGDSGDPVMASAAMDELFGIDVENHRRSFSNLLNATNEAGKRYGDTTQGKVLQSELNDMESEWGQFQKRFNRVKELLGVSNEQPTSPAAPQDDNSFFQGQFSIGGPQ